MAERIAEPQHDFLKPEEVDPKYWDIIEKNELERYEDSLADALDAQIQPYRQPSINLNTYPNPAEEYDDIVAASPEPLLEAGEPEGLLEATNPEQPVIEIPELIEPPETDPDTSGEQLAGALERVHSLEPRGKHANRLHYDDKATTQAVSDQVLNTYSEPKHRADETPTEVITIGARHAERAETASEKTFDELVAKTFDFASSILAERQGKPAADIIDQQYEWAALYEQCEAAGGHEASLKSMHNFLEQAAQGDMKDATTAEELAARKDEAREFGDTHAVEVQPVSAVDQLTAPITFKTAAGEIQQNPTQSIDISHLAQPASYEGIDELSIDDEIDEISDKQREALDLPNSISTVPELPAGAFMKLMQNIQKYPEGEYAVPPTEKNAHWPRVQYEGKWYLPTELPQNNGNAFNEWIDGIVETQAMVEKRKSLLQSAKDFFGLKKWGEGGLWERVQKLGRKHEAKGDQPEDANETEKTQSDRRARFVLGTVSLLALAGVVAAGAHQLGEAGHDGPVANHGIEQPDPYNRADIISTPTPTPSETLPGGTSLGQLTEVSPSPEATATPTPHHAEATGDANLEALAKHHDITINHNDGGDVLIDKFNEAFGTKLHYRDWTKFAGSLTDTYKMGEGYGLNYNNGSFNATDKLTMLKWAQSHGRM